MQEVHLEVSHHDQAHGIGTARHQGAGVDPAVVAVFDDLGVAQQTHHDHCGRKRCDCDMLLATRETNQFLKVQK